MTELLTPEALSVLLVAFGVGFVVGLTGMGGGALMTPLRIGPWAGSLEPRPIARHARLSEARAR